MVLECKESSTKKAFEIANQYYQSLVEDSIDRLIEKVSKFYSDERYNRKDPHTSLTLLFGILKEYKAEVLDENKKAMDNLRKVAT